jgi:hypothetical protein
VAEADLSLRLNNHDAMKSYGGVEIYLHAFLTSTLHGGELSASCLGLFDPEERDLSSHCIGGQMGSTDWMLCSHAAPSLVTMPTELSKQVCKKSRETCSVTDSFRIFMLRHCGVVFGRY